MWRYLKLCLLGKDAEMEYVLSKIFWGDLPVKKGKKAGLGRREADSQVVAYEASANTSWSSGAGMDLQSVQHCSRGSSFNISHQLPIAYALSLGKAHMFQLSIAV